MKDQTGANSESVADQKPNAYSALLGRAEVLAIEDAANHLHEAATLIHKAYGGQTTGQIWDDTERLIDYAEKLESAASRAGGADGERPTQ